MTPHPVHRRKKLIKVAIPLEAINAASAREKSIRQGHPSTLHLWWARRPLAAARAVIFCQMVDDPSAVPEEFPTEEAQENERMRLFALISELVTWENTTNEQVLNRARAGIRRSWRRACADNADHPEAAELFNSEKLPGFHDPIAGGGALPLDAQRLGLADDVRYYGQWMRDEAEKRIGHLYPKVEVMAEMAKQRPDLKPYVGKMLTVIAWLWARTVKNPNPAFSDVEVPLASTFMLSTKAGKEVYVEPVIESVGYRFTVKMATPKDMEAAKSGTRLAGGGNFGCLMSGTPMNPQYIKAEGVPGLVYLDPTPEQEAAPLQSHPSWKPEGSIVEDARAFTPCIYGIKKTFGRQALPMTFRTAAPAQEGGRPWESGRQLPRPRLPPLNHCEKTKQAEEARAYNGLMIAWPELEKRAAAASTVAAAPQQLSMV